MTSSAPRHAVRRRRFSFPAVAGLSAGVLLAATLPAQFATAAPATVVSDSFARTVSSGWGSAAKGGSWTASLGAGASAAVASGEGRITGLKPGASARLALKQANSLDTGVRATIGLPTASATVYTAFEIRRQSDDSTYRGRVEISKTGSAVLAVSRLNKTVEVNLGRFTLPGTYAPGADIAAEFQVTGSAKVSIRARAYPSGAVAPGWQLSLTDSSSSRISGAGSLAFWEYASGSNTNAASTTLDNLSLTQNPTTNANTPAPVPVPAPTPSPTTPPATPAQPVTPPVSTPVTSGDRGSATVGSTRYAVPAGAILVSPSGNDSANGNSNAPVRTLAAAVAKASNGATIVLRAGVYNESVTVPRSKTLTIQSYPGETVWLDGSKQVTDWNTSGSRWTTPWNYFPSSQIDGISDNPWFVDSAKPYAARPDQVFLDGTELTQVGSAAAVTAGTFYPDANSGRIVLGSNPNGHSVRISNQEQALVVQSPNTVLQGFGVRRYGTPYLQRGAVRLSNTGITARNLTVEDNAMIGINVESDNTTLDHLTVTGSGLLGIGANSAYGLKVQNSLVLDNNDQEFNAQPVAGGIKVTRSRGVDISNVDASDNVGNGIWLDESVYDATVVNSRSTDNTVDGILVELSDHVIVANNELNGNKIGVIVYNTANVQIYNNDIGGNRLFGVKLAQDERRQANTALTGHDRRRPLPDPTLTWITKNVTVSNNVFGSGGLFQIYALDGVTNIPVDNMNLVITGNLFNQRLTGAQSTLVGWGGGDNRTVTRYDSVQALAKAKGSRWNNVETTAVLPIASMIAAIKSALGVAVGIPDDVAAAIGVKSGTKGLGVFDD
ncbi:parallel beta-helix repeat protein [Frondihabitans sp. PhB161]|nr:parallel beta-helix repeat protein [Frondihabitans sp. PhB153]RPF09042.1 parallel beta-helix repeat protein [Frondihabitans sp. PhB161]